MRRDGCVPPDVASYHRALRSDGLSHGELLSRGPLQVGSVVGQQPLVLLELGAHDALAIGQQYPKPQMLAFLGAG